jgi:hypothetical protein
MILLQYHCPFRFDVVYLQVVEPHILRVLAAEPVNEVAVDRGGQGTVYL